MGKGKAADVSRKNKSKKSTDKKPSAEKPSHPPVADMVNEALSALKEKKGSSLKAIKKYIARVYMVDIKKLGVYIKRYLKIAINDDVIMQTKGTGAAGSFKLVKVPIEKKKAGKRGKKQDETTAKTMSPVKKTASKKQKEMKTVKIAKSPLKAKKAGGSDRTKKSTKK